MARWVLKDSQGRYLAATFRTKFDHLTMGDVVPEQAYALRFYERNDAARVANELCGGPRDKAIGRLTVRLERADQAWRIVRLRSTRARRRS